MANAEVAQLIKSTVLSLLPDARVLLFGSHARGDFNKSSDYDVLVITKENFKPHEKFTWRGKLNRALVYALHAPVDVLVDSEEEVDSKKELHGHIIRYAIREAIEL
ncbi:MAG: nucleotidyltransferase domain-containing protein [Bacteroidetes bacterium]|nr:nucleotidyltransferase domain-containing protein [Bacteroidota bacterium]